MDWSLHGAVRSVKLTKRVKQNDMKAARKTITAQYRHNSLGV